MSLPFLVMLAPVPLISINLFGVGFAFLRSKLEPKPLVITLALGIAFLAFLGFACSHLFVRLVVAFYTKLSAVSKSELLVSELCNFG